MNTIFDLCDPRDDVLSGHLTESDFAADLAQVIDQRAPKEYQLASVFFANTHPTKGLKNLLSNVALRLASEGGAASIFRLDTQYGGGKTHGLIALVHLAGGMQGVANASEFIDPVLIPRVPIRVAAFDGENADPANGRSLGHGLRAFTPWGELAYRLAGVEGYERVRQSDHDRIAPGADTLRELLGGEPALLLLDELSIYLRKIKGQPAAEQFTPFLTSLFKAVESAPGAVLVFTLAIGQSGLATDAYAEENQFVARVLEEAEKVVARKATVLDPTAENEVAQVLRRRLFANIDDAGAAHVVNAYHDLWMQNAKELPLPKVREDRTEELRNGYPFHPELMATLNDKLATLDNFQRVRGMLRLLTQAVARLWATRPPDTYAIHLHHLDPGFEPTHNEIVTRLGLRAYDPAMRVDVAAVAGTASLAEHLDQTHYAGMAPYASHVARTVLWHTFAYNEPRRGVTPEELRYSILAPGLDISFINDAAQRFALESAYLDDHPGAPLRFAAEANLTQIIRQQEKLVDPGRVRAVLDDNIRKVFKDGPLEMYAFPGGPYEVPHEVGAGQPLLVLIGYDADAVNPAHLRVPDLVDKIFRFFGMQNDFRDRKNNLVFLVADDQRREDMRNKVVRRLALEAMRQHSILKDLAEHQQDSVKQEYQKSDQAVAAAVQQCYRHLFYPSRNNQIEGAAVELGHRAFDVGAAEKPGAGQNQIVRSLAEVAKLLQANDQPPSPNYVRDLVLKPGQLTTLELRDEFRKDVRLPILLGNDNFIALVRKGIEQGVWIYRSGGLVYGPGDPFADVKIDNQAAVITMALATQQGIWPRPPVVPPSGGGTAGGGATGDPPPPDGGGAADGRTPGGAGPTGGSSPAAGGAPPSGPRTFAHEGPLKEALTVLWEKARSGKVKAITTLTLRAFDPTDIFRLLTAVGGVAGAEKHVAMQAEYETKAGAGLSLEFEGAPEDATPVKDFLDQEFRLAKEKTLKVTYTLTFKDGLSLLGDAPEKLAERLTRVSTGAALVQATAQESA